MRILSDISDYRNFPHIGWESEGVCRLVSDYNVTIEIEGASHKITIPAYDRHYDGLTAQKISSIVQMDGGRTTPAWLVHDDLYITKGKNGPLTLTRKQVDRVFYEMLLKLGYGPKRSWLAYKAVSLFGGLYW